MIITEEWWNKEGKLEKSVEREEKTLEEIEIEALKGRIQKLEKRLKIVKTI